jgi:hypothetical protein
MSRLLDAIAVPASETVVQAFTTPVVLSPAPGRVATPFCVLMKAGPGTNPSTLTVSVTGFTVSGSTTTNP